MGGLLGGGGGGGGLLGGGGGSGGGGGFLGNLLGGLPDPLGIGKMLFGFGEEKQPMGGEPMPPPGPSGTAFAPQGPASGVSYDPSQSRFSPMSPTGFGVGGGPKR